MDWEDGSRGGRWVVEGVSTGRDIIRTKESSTMMTTSFSGPHPIGNTRLYSKRNGRKSATEVMKSLCDFFYHGIYRPLIKHSYTLLFSQKHNTLMEHKFFLN